MNTSAPIIFCHYGNRSKYLPYILEAAKRTNADKEIILLGDEENRWLGKRLGIAFHLFEGFSSSAEIKEFDRVYRLVEGVRHGSIRGKRDWVNFVFRRWFHIHEFVRQYEINHFWHFDSDNMIMEPLQPYEAAFSPYDCTEQCGGSCLNGYIRDVSVVKEYLDQICALFVDQDFMGQVQNEMLDNPVWAFTEMRAFVEFKRRMNPNVWHAREPLMGATFDDCICQSHGVEMEFSECIGKEIKKVYLTDRGCFVYDEKWATTMRIPVLNLSWVPLVTFWVLERYLRQPEIVDYSKSYDLRAIKQFPTLAAKVGQSYKHFQRTLGWRDWLRRIRIWV